MDQRPQPTLSPSLMRLGLPLLLLGSWLLSSCTDSPPVLRVAVAANAQFRMEKYCAAFSEREGIPVEMIIGASGQLCTQILQGAPYNVFVSADLGYPEEIYRSGKALDRPIVYDRGRLVLWTLDTTLTLHPDSLVSSGIQRIAIANTTHAPYGKAALEYLENTRQLEPLQNLLVYGESISQVNQFLLSGAVTHVITALGVVQSEELRGRGKWILLPDSAHGVIEQGAVGVKSGEKEMDEVAGRFVGALSEAEVPFDSAQGTPKHRSGFAPSVVEGHGFTINQ